jgi:hypothetical protein
MLPALTDGQEVEVAVFDGATPRIGEVVLFLEGRATILHRVIARGAGWIRTQGDAAPGPDAPLPLSRILGTAQVPAAPLRAFGKGAASLARDALRRLLR